MAASAWADSADLAVSVDDGQDVVAQGSLLTYTVLVSNLGPDDAFGAPVSSTPDGDLLNVTWTCTAAPGSSCPASGSGNLSAAVDLPVNGSATFTFEGTVDSAATGSLSHGASILSPAGVGDPNFANNSDADVTALTDLVDLAVVLSTGQAEAIPGQGAHYGLEVTNQGPDSATDASLAIDLPDDGSCSWQCSASGGATCGNDAPSQSGNGDALLIVDLPRTARLTFDLDCTVPSGRLTPWTVRAEVEAAMGTTELATLDNVDVVNTSMAPVADVNVLVSDGRTTAVPGADTVDYTVTLGNLGPSHAQSVVVQSDFPQALGDLPWTCVPAGTATCTPSGSGDILDTITLPAGTSVTYFASAALPSHLQGTLMHQATVTPPSTVQDPNENNNQANDVTELTPRADLTVSKTDGATSVSPGTATQYSVLVRNLGPSDAPQSAVQDALPDVLSCDWTCLPEVGASCPATGSGDVLELVDLPAGLGITFTLDCSIDPDADQSVPDGVLSNTASVHVALGIDEVNPANNSATDLTQLESEADVRVTVDDGVVEAVPGTSLTYTVEVLNLGPADAAGVRVEGAQAAGGQDLDCLWTCVGSAGGSCTPGQVLGNLDDVAVLPLNTGVTYSVSCQVDPAATGVLIFGASATANEVTDPFPADNQASDADTQLTPQVDLRLVKDDGVATASPGDTLTYELMVSNDGPSQAADALVSDIFPDAVDAVSWTCAADSGAQCGALSGNGNLAETVELAPGSVLIFTAVALLRADATGSVVNQAEVTPGPGQDELQSADNHDTDTTVLEAMADLSIQLDDGLTSAVPGEAIAYQLTVHNDGPADVMGASVLAVLDDLGDVQWTCLAEAGAHCPATGTGAPDTSVDLAVGTSVVFSIDATIASQATGSLSPSATVTPPFEVTDPQGANNEATDIDTVLTPQADLSVQLDDGVGSAVPGLGVTYGMTVQNAGPSDAPGSRLHVPVPDGLQCTWSCLDDGLAACPNELPAGSLLQVVDLPATFQLQLEAQCSLDPALVGSLQVSAQVTAPETVQETAPANNQATDLDLLTPQADVLITKTDEQNVATPGDTLTYTLRVRNQAGPSNAPDVTVQDVFPNELDCLWSCQGQAGATCVQGQNTGHLLDVVQLPVGGEAVYTAQCTVDADASGDVVNSATATPPLGLEDLNASNNSALDTTALRPLVDVAIHVTDGVTEAVPGTWVTYTVTVQHLSGPDIYDVVVQDLFPAELSCLWTCEGIGGGICTPGQVAGNIVDLVDLPVGAEVRYTAVCEIDPDATGSLDNTATVEVPSGAHDPQVANNTSSDLDTQLTPRVDVAISKTDGVTSVAPDGEVTYQIEVSNAGPSSVFDAQVEDFFGADVDCTWTCATLEGATCTAGPIEGDLVDLVDLPVGSAVHYTAVCDVLAPAGSTLNNTATIQVPVNVEDTNPFNDQATDNDTRVEVITDLSLQLDNAGTIQVPGTEVTYSLVVERSPDALALIPNDMSSDDGMARVPGFELWRWIQGDDSAQPEPVLLGDVAASSCSGLAWRQGRLGAVCDEATEPGNESRDGWRPLRSRHGAPGAVPPSHVVPPIAAVSVDLTVQSILPAALDCTWTCVASPGSACDIGPSTGSLNETVSLAAGGRLTYEAQCAVDSAATGDLTLEAHLVVPAGVIDPTPDDQQDVDSDSLQPQVDIQVSKTDSVTQAAPGDAVIYSIEVLNDGPSDAPTVAVGDVFAANLDCLWSCDTIDGTGGTCAPGQTAGDLLDSASLPAGSGVAYTAVCQIDPNAFGMLANTAQAQPQGDVDEIDASNNQASDLDTVLVPRGDVQVSLSDDVQQATPGGDVHYVLHMLNDGPSRLTGVEVTDLFPEVLDCLWTCTPESGASCASGQRSGDLLDLVDLPSGAAVTYDATCRIDDDATGTLINQASASVPSDSEDPNLDNNTAQDDDTVLEPVADLAITLDNGVSQVAPGDTVTYVVDVRNHGPSADGAVQVTSPFDPALTCLWTCEPSPGAQCTVGPVAGDLVDVVSLPSGASVLYSAKCDLSGNATGELLHNVSVTPGDGIVDPDLNNNSAADLDTVLPLADVQLTKTDGVTEAVPGTSVTYTLTASNGGPSPAHDVELRDEISGLLDCTWTCTSTGNADCGSNVGTGGDLMALLQLPVGGVATWQGECAIGSDATGTLSNTATLALPDGIVDLDPSNNVASDTDTELTPAADLNITKDNGVEEVLAGEAVTYTMVAHNLGPSDAPAVTVHDVFPASLTCTWSCEAGSGAQCAADSEDGELVDVASLTAGAQATYTAVCAISSDATGSITNTVTVEAADDVVDPEPSNNSASDTDHLVDTVDLAIQVVDAPDPVQVGGTLFYGLVVTNQGPAAEAAPRVDIVLPPLVDLLSVVLGGPETIFLDGFEGGDTDAWNGGTSGGGGLPGLCQLSNETLTCQLELLASGEVQEMTFTVQVDVDAEDALVLTATVQGEGQDPDSSNNVDSEVTTVE